MADTVIRTVVGDELAKLALGVGSVGEDGRPLEVNLADQFLGNGDVSGIASGQHDRYAKYPVISSQGVMDIDGNFYTGVADVMDDPLIQKYQYIQYANLFDEIDPAWFEVK